MIHGIDTDFLVAIEIRDHLFHGAADDLLSRLLDDGHQLALLPQTLAEFIHVATDERRMKNPLLPSEAVSRAEFWWHAREITRLYPNAQGASQFLKWLQEHRLGRKRLLDTLLAASLHAQGIRHLITNNTRDFSVFAAFELVSFGMS